ncbi:serine/threonine-protein kinase [Chondromyces apiculatus]|uniref:Serine/threonine protein kinase n=1 Tax=Chondromyces apiculatus DSM 436 TaxID=1192034 RepID=A0A017TBB4_9BACT|nr:serine/threonine-protein kinase [Chondromyces apiculatus]EYF06548.1 serine/threonine protein kinase [Chondromyces apiculatus DSM 436]
MSYDDDAESWVGQTFAGKWRIERVLGIGGMGAVLLGRGADGSAVALKVLHPDLNAHPEVRKRFLLEGHIGNTLGGSDPLPGVVRTLGSGTTDDGTAYLAMEVLNGESLFDRMVRLTTMPPAEVLSMAEQVLDTLSVAHARGVVHRDLKPENIHIGADGQTRLLDFGIARVLDGLQGMPEKTATKTGMILGTATYMAPEQATGLINEIDGRTDLFGLGATMFRLLSGRPVHGDLSDTMEIIAAATEAPAPLATVAPNLPPDVAAIVDRALAFVKHHRYPDADTMRADVHAVRAGQPAPYARAVLEGRLHPGQRMVLAGPTPASRVAPTYPESAAVMPAAGPPAAASEPGPRRRPAPAATVLGLGPAAGAPPAAVSLPATAPPVMASAAVSAVEPLPAPSAFAAASPPAQAPLHIATSAPAPAPVAPTAPPGAVPKAHPSVAGPAPAGAIPSAPRPAATWIEPRVEPNLGGVSAPAPRRTAQARRGFSGGQLALLVGGASLALGILVGVLLMILRAG